MNHGCSLRCKQARPSCCPRWSAALLPPAVLEIAIWFPMHPRMFFSRFPRAGNNPLPPLRRNQSDRAVWLAEAFCAQQAYAARQPRAVLGADIHKSKPHSENALAHLLGMVCKGVFSDIVMEIIQNLCLRVKEVHVVVDKRSMSIAPRVLFGLDIDVIFQIDHRSVKIVMNRKLVGGV